MDLVYSWPSSNGSSSPLTAPEKTTSKQKKRKVLTNEGGRHPVRRKKGGKWVRETSAVALRGDDAPLNLFPGSSSSSHRRPVSSLMDEEVVNPSSPSSSSSSSSKSSSKYCLSKKKDCNWWCNQISGRWSDGFVDEEAVFNMPALLDGMAEGMLLTPFSWTQYQVDDEAIDFSLWVH